MGIDGGGTHTRVAITNTDGHLLSFVEWNGSANVLKDPNAKDNIISAIQEALKKANGTLSDVTGFCAGIAGSGYDLESDTAWVKMLRMNGLRCQAEHTGDSVIANIGAFLHKPGIIAISGTGSIVLGITETGARIRNYDYHHNGATAARFISYNTVFKILANEFDDTDKDLVSATLEYFGAEDIATLAKMGARGFVADKTLRDKQFSGFAPTITGYALQGSKLAQYICNDTAANIVTGIKLVGSCFSSSAVSVALVGGVACSAFINDAVKQLLCAGDKNNRWRIVKPAVPPVLGAVVMAMQSSGVILNDKVLTNICDNSAQCC